MYTELQKHVFNCAYLLRIFYSTSCKIYAFAQRLQPLKGMGFYRDIPAVTRDLSLSALPHRATPFSDLDLIRQARGTEDLF